MAAVAPVAAVRGLRLDHDLATPRPWDERAPDLGLRLGLALRGGDRDGRGLGEGMAPGRAVVFPDRLAGKDQLRAVHVPRGRAVGPRASLVSAPLVPEQGGADVARGPGADHRP